MKRRDKVFESPGAPDRHVGLGFVQEEIQPNTTGKFKKSKGEKGSETPNGPELDGYFRTDPDDIPLQEGDLVIWLDLPNGYDINPIFCDREEP